MTRQQKRLAARQDPALTARITADIKAAIDGAPAPATKTQGNRAARRHSDKGRPRRERAIVKRLRAEFAQARRERTPDEMVEWLHGRIDRVAEILKADEAAEEQS
jgi:hypothetical protein